MDTTGQSWVKTLCQPFGYAALAWNDAELGVGVKNLPFNKRHISERFKLMIPLCLYFIELAEGSDEIGPFARVLKVLESLVDGVDIVAILWLLDQFELFEAEVRHRGPPFSLLI